MKFILLPQRSNAIFVKQTTWISSLHVHYGIEEKSQNLEKIFQHKMATIKHIFQYFNKHDYTYKTKEFLNFSINL